MSALVDDQYGARPINLKIGGRATIEGVLAEGNRHYNTGWVIVTEEEAQPWVVTMPPGHDYRTGDKVRLEVEFKADERGIPQLHVVEVTPLNVVRAAACDVRVQKVDLTQVGLMAAIEVLFNQIIDLVHAFNEGDHGAIADFHRRETY